MIATTIGGISVEDWITSYQIDNPPVFGSNSFTDVTGVEVKDKLGDKVVLHISMEGLPHSTAASLATALQSDSIAVTYSTPAPASNYFIKTSYKAECDDPDCDENDSTVTTDVTWNIDVTLESLDYNTADDSDGL